MRPAYLLLIAAMLPVSLFSQSKPVDAAASSQAVGEPPSSESSPALFGNRTTAASQKVAESQQNLLELQPGPADQQPGVILLDSPKPPTDNFVVSPNAFSDGVCFAIRSYVVARDSKNSDSVHLVHYSTCRPANRYRLRSVQLQDQPPAR